MVVLQLWLQMLLGKANTGSPSWPAGTGMGSGAAASPGQVSHLHILQRILSDLFQPSPDKQKAELQQPAVEGWRRSGGSLLDSPTQLLITKISLAPSSCLLFILAWLSPGPAQGAQAVQPSQTQREGDNLHAGVCPGGMSTPMCVCVPTQALLVSHCRGCKCHSVGLV